MASGIIAQSKVVPFMAGWRVPVREQHDPMDLAVFDVEQACHDISQVVHQAPTVDAALALRRRIAALVTKLGDVELLANARAEQLNRLCR